MAFQVGRKRKLLAEVAKLTHSDRVRHMSELGRDHAGTRELRKLLDSLNGDLYEWQLRVYAARAAGEPLDILEALASPLRSVRSLAIVSLRTLDVDFDVLTEAVTDMAAADRRALLTVVRQRGNPAVADGIIAGVYDRFGADEASVIVAACSDSVVAEWLPRLAHAMSNWPSLARAHPHIFVEFLREQMSLAAIVRDAWWTRAAAGISELVDIDPAAALDLWTDFGPDGHLPGPIAQKLPRLATEDIDRTLSLLLQPKYRAQVARLVHSLRKRIARADDRLIARLAQAVVHDQQAFATVLGAVAPSRRAELFDQATAGIDVSQLIWHKAVLDALPHQVRHSETRRMLGLPAYQNADTARHELMVWLPIEDTWDELCSATHANDALFRAAAYRRLVAAVLAGRSPLYFDRLLTELMRLRNEQDPVRGQALGALSQCAVHLVTLDNMTLIDDLVVFAVEARDTSHLTVAALTTLLQRVLANSTTPESVPVLERCVDGLTRLAGQNGRLQLGSLYENLPANGEFVLFDALEPRLRADARAGRPELLFTLVRALGPRGHGVEKLQAALAELTRSKVDAHARRAIQLWLDVPGNRAGKIGELIDWEPSTVLVPPVFELLSLTRQDLLHIALSNRALTGRFAASTRPQIPMLLGGFHRWLPSQRRTYSALLQAAIDNEHTGYLRMGAIRSLARIPEVGTAHLRQLIEAGDVISVEAALAGLAWGESPDQELATLLSYANTDRARVAIYSATRAARFTRPDELDRAIRALLEADDSKLTARKEALRILGQNRTPRAIDTLAWLWTQRPLHRSLAIALASALRNYPDNDLTWEVYRELAAGEGDEAYAVSLSMTALSWPEECRSPLALIAASLAQHEMSTVRDSAWANLASLRPWNDDIATSLRDAVCDLSSVASWRPAVRQLHLLLDGYPDDPVLADTVQRLAEQPVPAGVADARDRDLSVQQRLEALAAVWPVSPPGKATMRLAAEQLVALGFAGEAALFVTSGVDWAEPEVTLRRLVELGESHSQAVPRLSLATQKMLAAAGSSGEWTHDDVLPICEQLAQGAAASGLVAAAVVSVAGPLSGWSQPWRQVLSVLRKHDSVWVQSNALQTRTATE